MERASRQQRNMHSVDACPAFKDGCPFSEKGGTRPTECPAFAEGCPFKHVKTASELEAALSDVPKSHGVDGSQAKSTLVKLLGTAHEYSGCPVFAQECPFKNIDALKRAATGWRGWWTHPATEDDEDQEEEERHDSADEAEKPKLSKLLKDGTEVAHAEAENVQFVRALLERRAPLAAYCALLASLRIVYEALERASDALAVKSTNETVRLVCGKEFGDKLRRVNEIDKDLDFFGPGLAADARAFAAASPAVAAYAKRLLELGADDQCREELLIAHLYTRYLGDLSGGQILKRAVKRSYGLDDDHGVDLYNFPLIGGPTQLRKFKERYRLALDDLDSLEDPAPVVDEAVRAFRYNTALLTEIDALLGEDQSPQKEEESAAAVCPFLAGKKAAPENDQKACPHSSTLSKSAQGKSKCPFHNLGVKDYVVFALVIAGAIYLTIRLLLFVARAVSQ